MPLDFGQDAAQLINKGKILFHGYNVVLCPVTQPTPPVTVDLKWNCYCINLPVEYRECWLGDAEYYLEHLYRKVICRAKDNSGDASPQQ